LEDYSIVRQDKFSKSYKYGEYYTIFL